MLEFGATHDNAIIRALDVSIALSHCGQHHEKKLLLEPIMRLRKTAGNSWLLWVVHLEHSRACLALAEYSESKRSLRPLWKLKGSRDRFLALLFAEGPDTEEDGT